MAQFEFQTVNPQGEPTNMTDQDILREMSQAGEQIVAISPDGMNVTLQDSKGQFQTSMQNIIEDYGHQLKGFHPLNPDESMASAFWRMGVSELQDPDSQKAYLESKLKREGFQNPQIIGSGRDWYAFNPQNNQWSALTNKKGWDWTDIGEAVPMLAKGIGQAAGTTLGATAGSIVPGAGTITGMAAGGAGGGMLAEGAIQGLEALDPDYREAMTASQTMKNLGIEGLAGAIPAAGMGAAVKYGSPIIKALGSTGPISSIGRGISWLADKGGSLASKAANSMRGSQIATDLATGYAIPPLGAAQGAGFIAQVPEMAIKGIPNLVAKGAETGIGKQLLGEEASAQLAQDSRGLLTPRPGMASKPQQINRFMRGKAEESQAPDIMRNLGEKIFAPKPVVSRADALEAGWTGEIPVDPSSLARQEKMANIFEQFGHGAKNLATAGRVTEEGIRGTAKAGLFGADMAGRATSGLGKIGYNASTLAQPFENALYGQAALRHLAEEALTKKPLQKTKSYPRMNTSI